VSVLVERTILPLRSDRVKDNFVATGQRHGAIHRKGHKAHKGVRAAGRRDAANRRRDDRDGTRLSIL
jgi:hypothetical protein